MVSMIVSAGCAKSDWIERTLVTVDVTGEWFGTMGKAPVTSEARLVAKQQGTKVTGYFRPLLDYPGWTVKPGPIDGNIAGDAFHFQMVDGSVADLTISGDEMRGTISMGRPVPIFLRRVDSSAPPRSQ